ncbi:conserved exported hypothetical protein [Vibrio crassostreae]|uniref:hypothetical protein n=1 Tax=Vibrio crassostreae TaxID=246167 RepID=UPI001BD654F1|nr:hypothetical protein [Vibrio crassostreae]CAK2110696.1 conserved exported hypothetical protein [Vibrio crassostreae]CAK2119441.1 conserved exported hypothetical protein [Vibrio crassostreae]CAK2363839.1 conserved exported hypothetical protein [Vibrio crassostreae]CAK2365356.1 conserved exported hypothetical protein [Vibrio crassostreae]CAK2371245.1 conserved exported hypothetical protein [Vibrio crassostreae]
MKNKKIILTFILALGVVKQLHAGGGAIAFTPLKTPIIVPDGNTSDWNQIKDNKLIHIVHEESGIEFYTIDHLREERGVTEILNKNVRSFLIKVPKNSGVKEALITLRDVKDGKFRKHPKPLSIGPFPDIYSQAPSRFKEGDTFSQYIKISRNLDNGGINGDWKASDNNRSRISNVKGAFEGSLSLTPITLTSMLGKTDIYTYFPIRHRSALGGSATSFLVHSVDGGDYEYLELTIPEFVSTGYKRRIFITYTFDRSSDESVEISDNLFSSPGDVISYAAICGSSCPTDPYEALGSFYEDGVSIQISVTGQVDRYIGTASVTTNMEETLSDVSFGVGNRDFQLELGVVAFNTSDLSAITEGQYLAASFDFQPVVSPGVTMVTNPDFSVVGIGGTVGISGLPGYNLATGWGVDGGGGVSTTPEEPTDNNSSSSNSGNDSNGSSSGHNPNYGGHGDTNHGNDNESGHSGGVNENSDGGVGVDRPWGGR